MVSSVTNKELNHEWENERYKDYQESMRNLSSSSKTENLVEPKSDKKASKQEIYLPKTRLSRTGQLLLFTSENEKDLYETRINSILAKNSKNWIDDADKELNSEASKFLDERLDENLNVFLNNRNSRITKIMGKNSKYLIQDLKIKSGKDRRLQRASYLEYLPSDFDPKNELADALKSLNPLNNNTNTEVQFSGRQNKNSSFSIAEISDCISTDDEKDDKQFILNTSRLSSHPVLSTQNLIKRLSSTANVSHLLRDKPNELNVESIQKSSSPGTKHSENELVVNYKETFQFDFINDNNNLNEIDKNKKQPKETSNEKKTVKIEPQKNILSSKKILDKRYFIRIQNTSPVNNSRPENSETITLKQPPRSARNNSLLNVKNNNNRQALYSGNRKKDVSSNNDDSSNLNNLAILGYKKLENDDNISTLLTKNSLYSSFANNYTPGTPMPSHDKILSSGPTYKPAVYFKPAPEDENIEPITISVTEIENENTGNSVRIRRFFDRQSIRINKISLNTESKPNLYTRLQKSLSANSVRNKQIKNSEIEEPHVDNFAIKLNPKIIKKDEKNRIKSAPIEQNKIIDISNISNANKIGSNNNSVKSSRKQSIVSIKNELAKNIDNDIPDPTSMNYESLGHTTDRIDDVNELPTDILDLPKEEKQASDIHLESNEQVENLQYNNWPVKNSPNSDSDKNVQSVDYVDNLSISSRISPSRKDSTYLNDFVEENYEEKIETESEVYEKLDRMKNKAENSHSDYQEIVNSESQVPEDEQNENIIEDDNKIETILEENVELSHIELDEEKSQDQFFEEIPEIEEGLYVEPEDEQNIFENKNENFDENKTVESQDYNKKNYVETLTGDNDEKLYKESDKDEFFSYHNDNDVQNTVEISVQENNLTKDIIEENYLNDEMSQINLEKQVKIESPISVVEEDPRPFSSDIEANPEVKNIKLDDFKEEPVKSENTLNLINQDSLELNLKNNSVKSFETTKTESIHERNISENEKSLQSYDETDSIQPKNTAERKISISIVLNQAEFIYESKSTFSNQREAEDNMEKNEPEIVVLDTNKNEDLIKKEYESINNVHDVNLNNFSFKKEIIDEKVDLFVKPEKNLRDSNTSLTIEPLVDIKKTDLKLENKSLNENDLNKLLNNNEKQGKKVEFSNHVMEKIINKVDESISETKKKEETLAIPKIQMVDSIESNIKPNEEIEKESVIVHPPSQKPPLNRPTARTTTAVKQTVKNPRSNSESQVKSEDVLKIQPIETSAQQVEKKLDLSKFDALLGIKHDESKQENYEEEKRFKKPVKESKFEKKMREKKERYKNFPYLQLPWDSREAIVDESAYREAFSVPDVLSPLIHIIDPTSTSVDELILERRILEDKILELRNEKLNIVNMTDDQRAKLKNKKKNKKQELTKINKEIDVKEKVIREERIRLQHEAYKRQTERDNVGKLLEESIEGKNKEIDNLNKELENSQKELNSQLSSIMQQINYLEGTEDEIRDALSQARNELRDRIKKNHQETRKAMKEMHEDRRESKLFDFNVKQKELEWLIGMYTDSPDETNKIKAKQSALEAEIEQWLFKFENDCIDQEKEIDDKEAEEENLIVSMEQEEEDNALKSIKQEQFELLQEKKNLIENFEEIKTKIIQRIEKISEEKLIMEGEKLKFDQNTQMDIEKQKQKLVEILEAEKQAKEEIKKELENYKQALFLRRDKNLALKSNLSFLNHSQQITKPYVFSYVMHWPIELFGRPFDQDKMKKAKPKK